MFVEIISIGNELLSGNTLDTNSNFLCKNLTKSGYIVKEISTISDNSIQIKEQIEKSIKRTNIVITTGSLGPTLDDLSKNTFLNFIDKNKTANIKNSQGSAPSYLINTQKGILALLPGVPIEMIEMFNKNLLPYLLNNFKPKNNHFSSNVNLVLINEIDVNKFLKVLKNKHSNNIDLRVYPSPGLIRVQISSTLNNEIVKTIKKNIEKYFFSYIFPNNISILEAINEELRKQGLYVATAESCTGGLLAYSFSSIPGASKCFKTGIVAYKNEIKKKLLNVKEQIIEKKGAVSKETVREMINGLFQLTDADIAIATSGIAGPTGGTTQKPIGTVYIAVSQKSKYLEIKKYQFQGNRELIIINSVNYALGLLWRKLKYNKFD